MQEGEYRDILQPTPVNTTLNKQTEIRQKYVDN